MKGGVHVLQTGNSWNSNIEMEPSYGDKQEHIKEAAKVISRYMTLLITTERAYYDSISTSWGAIMENIEARSIYFTISKICWQARHQYGINMFHPCQSMADMMTMIEHLAVWKRNMCSWRLIPKNCHSPPLIPSFSPLQSLAWRTAVCPNGFELIMIFSEWLKKTAVSGGSVSISRPNEAFKDAVLLLKSWASLKYFGDWKTKATRNNLRIGWWAKKMNLTNNALFLHCLPVAEMWK